MKKFELVVVFLLMLFVITGCKDNNLDDAKIYTTVYPVEYITKFLYGENSTVESIYPKDVNLDEYELTSKQIDIYASGDLFVYIGLTKERDYAKSLLNKNHNLLLIDATYSLSSDNITELWLAPNNFLMLVKNIRNSLNEYLKNSLKEEQVNLKYNELYEKVSWLDAELRSIAKEATKNGNDTLVIATNDLKFLEDYGFKIVSLEDIENSNSQNAKNDIKNRFKNGTYNHILKLNTSNNSDLVSELVSKYKANILNINSLITNSDISSDYVTIQYENIAVIRDLLIK